eukprot:801733_1
MAFLGDEVDDDEKSTNSSWSAHSAPTAPSKHKNGKQKKVKKRVAQQTSPSPSPDPNSPEDATLDKRNMKYMVAKGAYADLGKKERREFQRAFRLFDKDEDGQISVYELKQVFEGLNYHFSDMQLIKMLQSVDDNGDGKVDMDEFVRCMKGNAYNSWENCRPYIEELQEAFEVFDKNGDGKVDMDEFVRCMKGNAYNSWENCRPYIEEL